MKSPEDISKKMVASKQNKSEKILSIFLTKIPIPADASEFSITPIWAYFYACFAHLKFTAVDSRALRHVCFWRCVQNFP